MLKIRDEQMKVFEEAALQNFEDEMVQHIKEFAPRHSEIIGDDVVRQVVRIGIERAKGYGLINRGPVRFYIELMFMLGSDFDTDPQYPRAGEILKDPATVDQMERADRLYDKIRDYVEKVAGTKNKNALRALNNLRSHLAQGLPGRGLHYEEAMIRLLKSIYPEKCAYLGDTAVRTLIVSGVKKAQAQSLDRDGGGILFVGLMFMLGQGFPTDPQFPWISATLSNPLLKSPEERIERLREKSLTYLDKVLNYLEEI